MTATIRPEAIDGAVLDGLPWGNFPHGEDAREAVRLLRTKDGSARSAMGVLIGMCADDSRAAAALAVPFLIRIATDPHHPDRTAALGCLAAQDRARYSGAASRAELLLHRPGPRHEDYDDYGVEVTGYPAGWSVAAARAAITAGTPLLLPPCRAHRRLLRSRHRSRPRPYGPSRVRYQVRQRAGPMVLAAMILATAETTRAHPHPPAAAWIREVWQDRAQAPEVRLAAAIGWLCLTDEPTPDALHTAIDVLADEERARAMEALPWMAAVGANEPGLLRCVRCMLHPEYPEPYSDDPWSPGR
ncbi:hypothetical protein [Streptomyces sp. NPDC054797]